jgi:hypothetical protein
MVDFCPRVLACERPIIRTLKLRQVKTMFESRIEGANRYTLI